MYALLRVWLWFGVAEYQMRRTKGAAIFTDICKNSDLQERFVLYVFVSNSYLL